MRFGAFTFSSTFAAICLAVTLSNCSKKAEPTYAEPTYVYHPRGFEEVTGAREGDLVTVTEGIDIKGMCLDVNEAQREVCSTSLIGSGENARFIKIKLWLCSERRDRNCLVWPHSDSKAVDFREVYVIDDKGQPIDFDGEYVIEEPGGGQGWMSQSQKLRLTGRVSIVDGHGEFVEPILKIEEDR